MKAEELNAIIAEKGILEGLMVKWEAIIETCDKLNPELVPRFCQSCKMVNCPIYKGQGYACCDRVREITELKTALRSAIVNRYNDLLKIRKEKNASHSPSGAEALVSASHQALP